MMIIKIALLNLFRNCRRSGITVLAVAVGCMGLIIFDSYLEGMFRGLRETFIRTNTGHIRISKAGYNEFKLSNPENYMMDAGLIERVSDVLDQTDHVEVYSSRMRTQGLLSNGKTSYTVLVTGSEAEKDYLINSFLLVEKGEYYNREEQEGVVIGAGLAESSKVEIGEYLTLLGATLDGSFNAVDVKISGIVRSGIKEMDERLLIGNLSHVQLLADSESVSEIVILLDETENTDKVFNLLKKEFDRAGMDVELIKWIDTADFYIQVRQFLTNLSGFLRMVVILTVFFSIGNTMTMSVLERTSELGTIRAIGETKFRTFQMVMWEAIFIGLIGAGIGILAGYAGNTVLNAMDLQQSPPPGTNRDVPVILIQTYEIFSRSFLIGLISALISGIIPGIKAVNMKIVDAIRYV